MVIDETKKTEFLEMLKFIFSEIHKAHVTTRDIKYLQMKTDIKNAVSRIDVNAATKLNAQISSIAPAQISSGSVAKSGSQFGKTPPPMIVGKKRLEHGKQVVQPAKSSADVPEIKGETPILFAPAGSPGSVPESTPEKPTDESPVIDALLNGATDADATDADATDADVIDAATVPDVIDAATVPDADADDLINRKEQERLDAATNAGLIETKIDKSLLEKLVNTNTRTMVSTYNAEQLDLMMETLGVIIEKSNPRPNQKAAAIRAKAKEILG